MIWDLPTWWVMRLLSCCYVYVKREKKHCCFDSRPFMLWNGSRNVLVLFLSKLLDYQYHVSVLSFISWDNISYLFEKRIQPVVCKTYRYHIFSYSCYHQSVQLKDWNNLCPLHLIYIFIYYFVLGIIKPYSIQTRVHIF